MTKDVTIISKVIDLTEKNSIKWKNFKLSPAKRNHSREDFLRIKTAVRYRKRSIAGRTPINKHQSYYAISDNLVFVLLKNAVDDSLVFIAGEVNQKDYVNHKGKLKKKDFDSNLAAYKDGNQEKLLELHKLVHKVDLSNQDFNEEFNMNDFLKNELS